jgi:hypothetical protein
MFLFSFLTLVIESSLFCYSTWPKLDSFVDLNTELNFGSINILYCFTLLYFAYPGSNFYYSLQISTLGLFLFLSSFFSFKAKLLI